MTKALMMGMTEFVSGRATQVALNLVSGERWDTNLWNPQDPQWQLDVLLDVVPGVAAGMAGEAWQAFKAARAARYADLPSVSGLDDAVRYADDVPSVRQIDDTGKYADDLVVRARQSDVPSASRQLDPEQRAAGKALLEQRLREIAPQMGIDDPYSLVDEVVFHERWTNPTFVVRKGTSGPIRNIYAGPSFLERSEAGQLIAASHELGHAQNWDNLVRAYGGDWRQAYAVHRSATGTVLESLEEITVELRARETVTQYLGEIDARTLADSVDFINRKARETVVRGWPDIDTQAVSGPAGRVSRQRLSSLQRQLGVGVAGIKKHVRAWVSRGTPNLDALPDLEAIRAPEPFNTKGMEKNIFDVLDARGYSPERARAELVWLQPKRWGGPNLMEGELAGLKMLEEYGLPTPRNFGKTEYTDILGIRKTAVIQERLVGGSRDYIEMNEMGDLGDLRASPLNERTIQDLQQIRHTLVSQHLEVPDLQFLVAADGRVVVNDPQMPRQVASGAELGLREIDKLIEASRRAIELRAQN